MSEAAIDYTDAHFGRTHFRARPSRQGDGFVSWCADTPDLGDSAWDVPGSRTVMIGWGRTAEQAIYSLRQRFVQ